MNWDSSIFSQSGKASGSSYKYINLCEAERAIQVPPIEVLFDISTDFFSINQLQPFSEV